MLEAVARAFHLQDVDVLGETVQQRPGLSSRGKLVITKMELCSKRWLKTLKNRLSRDRCFCRLSRRLSSRALLFCDPVTP